MPATPETQVVDVRTDPTVVVPASEPNTPATTPPDGAPMAYPVTVSVPAPLLYAPKQVAVITEPVPPIAFPLIVTVPVEELVTPVVAPPEPPIASPLIVIVAPLVLLTPNPPPPPVTDPVIATVPLVPADISPCAFVPLPPVTAPTILCDPVALPFKISADVVEQSHRCNFRCRKMHRSVGS